MASLRNLLIIAGAVLVAAGVAGLIARSQRLPTGPVPVTWDKEPCAHCHMLLSEPGFAVQLQEADGTVLNFDDPGCWFAWESESRPAVHALWFHDLRGDAWHPASGTAFLPGQTTPMAFGFGAVAVGTPGALSLDEARAQVLAMQATRAPS